MELRVHQHFTIYFNETDDFEIIQMVTDRQFIYRFYVNADLIYFPDTYLKMHTL